MSAPYSTNARAERVMGRRAPGIAFDCPCELGYACPVCKIAWDEELTWSEYRSFLWCPRCNFDYPSALCVRMDAKPDPERPYVNAGREAAVKVFLDSVEAAQQRERLVDLEAFLLNVSAWLEHGDAGKLTKDGLRTHGARLMQPIEAEHAASRVSSPEGAQRT